MIKIKLYEHEIHRNETTFRPFISAQNIFKDIGISFTTSDDYDYAFVGQASIIDKKKILEESIEKSLDILNERYASMNEILQKPIFFDSLEIRQVISDIRDCHSAVLLIANILTNDMELISDESKKEEV